MGTSNAGTADLLRKIARVPLDTVVALLYSALAPAALILSGWGGGLPGTLTFTLALAATVVSTTSLLASLDVAWTDAAWAGGVLLFDVVVLLGGVASLGQGQVLLGVAFQRVGAVDDGPAEESPGCLIK